ncbi:MAG: DUF427 domain-containing protein [Roseitalea sp.]|nr:DUF427 domain-containing protein [Roseitalea sp.]MBO6723246.1 DUF427 domain-containing protein [Roseitalea sp.]MBO6744420.1 DUF427 domain-containing protein [Roseitalea sp.]
MSELTRRVIENVEDYPRPPALEPVDDTIRIVFAGQIIAETDMAYRVLETFHAPTYYLPLEAFTEGVLRPAQGASVCEWKGRASYFDIVSGGQRASRAAWSYLHPTANFAPIRGFLAVYAEPMDACFVGGERVEPQPGNFYGGWVTSGITGPVKGAPGTTHW